MKDPPRTPLSHALHQRIRFLALRLRPGSAYHYTVTARNFLRYLGHHFPAVRRASQLRRDPHVLGWMEQLAARRPPLSVSAHIGHRLRLRRLFEDLNRPGLLRSEDIPRADLRLPRPLSVDDDARLQQYLRARDDLLSNALLLLRTTALRIGELLDLPLDCLHHIDAERWALCVPVGKLHSERWVPVDPQTRHILARILTLRPCLPHSSDTDTPAFLFPRPVSRHQWMVRLRQALRQAAQAAGCSRPLVPHQLRHTCGTAWIRSGMSLPAVMKLMGHTTPAMTMCYIQVTQTDLQREYLLGARQSPHRFLLPADRPAHSLVDALRWSLHLLDASRTQSRSRHWDTFRRRLLRIIRAAQDLMQA